MNSANFTCYADIMKFIEIFCLNFYDSEMEFAEILRLRHDIAVQNKKNRYRLKFISKTFYRTTSFELSQFYWFNENIVNQ
jgi:hypothetical protein